jgi:hypothetical protein
MRPTVEDNQLTLKKSLKGANGDDKPEDTSTSLIIKAALSVLVIYLGWRFLGKGRHTAKGNIF